MTSVRGDRDAGVIDAICPGCGGTFACTPRGKCWCGQESFRLPMPAPGSGVGCWCPSCLREVARKALVPSA